VLNHKLQLIDNLENTKLGNKRCSMIYDAMFEINNERIGKP